MYKDTNTCCQLQICLRNEKFHYLCCQFKMYLRNVKFQYFFSIFFLDTVYKLTLQPNLLFTKVTCARAFYEWMSKEELCHRAGTDHFFSLLSVGPIRDHLLRLQGEAHLAVSIVQAREKSVGARRISIFHWEIAGVDPGRMHSGLLRGPVYFQVRPNLLARPWRAGGRNPPFLMRWGFVRQTTVRLHSSPQLPLGLSTTTYRTWSSLPGAPIIPRDSSNGTVHLWRATTSPKSCICGLTWLSATNCRAEVPLGPKMSVRTKIAYMVGLILIPWLVEWIWGWALPCF